MNDELGNFWEHKDSLGNVMSPGEIEQHNKLRESAMTASERERAEFEDWCREERARKRCPYRCHACRNRCKGKDGHSSPFDYRGHFCKNHKRAPGKTDV